jgi:hypothetical protein
MRQVSGRRACSFPQKVSLDLRTHAGKQRRRASRLFGLESLEWKQDLSFPLVRQLALPGPLSTLALVGSIGIGNQYNTMFVKRGTIV